MDYSKEHKKLRASCIREIKAILEKCENNEHIFKTKELSFVGPSGNFIISSIKLSKNGKKVILSFLGRLNHEVISNMKYSNELFDLYKSLKKEINK